LLEVFKEVRGAVEEPGNLAVNVLNWLGFALIGLQDFEELFVNVWMGGKSVLR
jgi:hypothetical protein